MDKSGRGFLTFAEDSDDTNYLELAYAQALSIKRTNPKEKYAVIVNNVSESKLTEKHREVFDHIIPLKEDWNSEDSQWRLQNECQVFDLTPFKETIKVESDMIFTRSIEHWWHALRLRDLVFSVGCLNYRGEVSEVRDYREFFDLNHLPDIYNGLMYFRFSQTAYNFFELAKQVRQNWKGISETLKKCYEKEPSTDSLYAVTALMFGEDKVTIPTLNFFRFAHMKHKINGLAHGNWYRQLLVEWDDSMMRIDHINQLWPVHYHDKSFLKEIPYD